MIDIPSEITDQAIRGAIKIIDNTKDEAWYAEQRAKADTVKILQHQFIQDVQVGDVLLDPTSFAPKKPISFTVAYMSLEGNSEENNALIKKRFAEQLFEALRELPGSKGLIEWLPLR